MAKREIQIASAIERALTELGISPPEGGVKVERPARLEHGDYATSVALELSKPLGKNPRSFAQEIIETRAISEIPHLKGIELAGPGFINFRLMDSHLHESLLELLSQGEDNFARSELGHGEKIQLEFVSANPTGPLHVGNAWWASYGDAIKRVLERSGFNVKTEYYVNDTGGQIRTLGESLLARRSNQAPPEDGYQGEYVVELAKKYNGPDDVLEAGKFAVKENLAAIKASLLNLNINFDEWFSQASIEESGAVGETIEILASMGATYEKDGALWLEATRFGDNRDRVLRKSDGYFTYLAGDIAYHRNKFLVRGFDRVIDIFGADHHGQVASLKAAMSALGIEAERLEILIGQMVSLVEGDRKVKFSKRAGNIVSMEWLVSELGPAVTRLLSLSSSLDRAAVIDIEEAKSTSMDNPAYYIQYAHARIASIFRVAESRGVLVRELAEVPLDLLKTPRELELIRTLISLPDVVDDAAISRAPQRIVAWLKSLASAFHGFYHDCPILAEGIEEDLLQARLQLARATQIGLRVALFLVGIEAPEQM